MNINNFVEIEGPAAYVQTAVQNTLNDHDLIDHELRTLREVLSDTPLAKAPETNQFYKAGYFKSAVAAIGAFAVIQDIFPRVTAWHEHHRTLQQDANLTDPIAIGQIWVSEAKQRVMAYLEAKDDPLLTYFQTAQQTLFDAHKLWKQTPVGKKSWPSYQLTPEQVRKDPLRTTSANVAVASEHLAAFSVYASLHLGINGTADSDALEEMTREVAVPVIVAASSAHRHFEKTPENAKLLQEGREDEAIFSIPGNATARLSIEAITKNGLQATINHFAKSPAVKSPVFCPHGALADGPLKRPWRCAGAVFAGYSDATDVANARAFFSETGFLSEYGERFSPVLALSALMAVVHRDTQHEQWLRIIEGSYPDIPDGKEILAYERRLLT